jgi:hypothetical protein
MKRQLSWIGIAALLLSLSGCPFKKKQPPIPHQGQAPTVQPEPVPPPPVQPPAETEPVPPPPETLPEKAEIEKKPPTKKPSPKKPAAPAPATQGQQQAATTLAPPAKTSKLIIQEGDAPNSQGPLAAGVGQDDSSSHAKQTTEQLLQSAQTNLNSINRPLSPDEQAMVAQIKDYMAQSRKAAADSDNVRAHNLALKAHLLSDELVKH